MELKTKPNPWSCVGSAFAMVLDISTADFFGLVGHDGSQIAFPMLPDPMARRGLHIQECIAACTKLGYAVTPIELFPVIQSTPPSENNIVVLSGSDFLRLVDLTNFWLPSHFALLPRRDPL